MRIAVVATQQNDTNARLVRAGGCGWTHLTPPEALHGLAVGDVALARLDVLPSLDGVDGGLRCLGALEARGIRVLNPASALIAAHDKLITARLLQAAGIPHPRTWCVSRSAPEPPISGPVVVKPRFGSWGRDVVLCEHAGALRRLLDHFARRPWFAAHGALVQELVAPRGYDLRVLVAGRQVVGAIRRVAARGEWRTNIALGGHREPVVPPPDACELALASAVAAGADLVGVDLLPTADGWTVLELNGAVDFTEEYSVAADVFAAATEGITRVALTPAVSEPARPLSLLS